MRHMTLSEHVDFLQGLGVRFTVNPAATAEEIRDALEENEMAGKLNEIERAHELGAPAGVLQSADARRAYTVRASLFPELLEASIAARQAGGLDDAEANASLDSFIKAHLAFFQAITKNPLADPASRRMAITRVGELLLARQAELDGGQG